MGGFALAASAGWNLANVGAVAGRTSAAYGVGLAVVGLFTTALVLTHAAMQIPAGRLCDRFGARLVGAAGLVVIGLSRRSPGSPGARRGSRSGSASSPASDSPPRSSVAPTTCARRSRSPVAQGFYGATSMASGGLALALVPLWPGWRAPFVTSAIVAAVGLVLVALAPADVRQPGAAQAARIFDRRLLPLGVMHAASFGLSVVLGNWVATLLERGGDESAHVAGVVGGLVLFLGVFSRPLGGRLRRPTRRGAARASWSAPPAIALLAVARPLPLAVIAATIVGLAAGVPFACAFSGAQRLRPDAPAAAVGVVNLAATLVILVGTPLVGFTFSLPGGGRVGFAIAAVLCLAATASARKLHAVPSFR